MKLNYLYYLLPVVDLGQVLAVSDHSGSIERLKQDIQSLWSRYGRGDPQINFHNAIKNEFPWLEDSEDNKKKPTSEWLFDTWTPDELRNILKEHSIKCDLEETKDDLISKLKVNYEKVTENLTKGRDLLSPPNEIFNNWSVEDLKNWLVANKVKYDTNINNKRDALVETVRDNIYEISVRLERNKYNDLNSLELARKQLIDKTGELTDTVFVDWSPDELKKWLQLHQIVIENNEQNSKDDLQDLAKKHQALLKNDINWYLEKSKEYASPFIGKTPEFVKDLFEKSKGQLSNTKFKFNDINEWSYDEIKKLLDFIKVEYPKSGTKNDLFKLLKSNAESSMEKIKEQYSDAFHVSGVKNWFQKQISIIKRSKFYHRVTGTIDNVNNDVNSMANDLNKEMNELFKSWSVEDLKLYLKQFGPQYSKTNNKNDLITKGEEITRHIFGYPKKEPVYKQCYNKLQTFFKNACNMIFNW